MIAYCSITTVGATLLGAIRGITEIGEECGRGGIASYPLFGNMFVIWCAIAPTCGYTLMRRVQERQ